MASPTLNAMDVSLGHFGLRILIGVNMLLHGLVRLPDLSGFANGIAAGFEGTWMPPAMALPFGYAIPLIEVVLGVSLLLGLCLRWGLVGSLVLMWMLTAGMCLQQNWAVVGSQLIYGGVFAALLVTRSWARWTLDEILWAKK